MNHEILCEKGNFLLFLKILQDSPSFKGIETFCQKPEGKKGKCSCFLYPGAISTKLKMFEELGLIKKEFLPERINNQFTRYSLDRKGMVLFDHLLNELSCKDSRVPNDVKSLNLSKFKTESILWEKGILLMTCYLWQEPMSFHELARRFITTEGPILSFPSIFQKLKSLTRLNFLLKKKINGKVFNYSLSRKGKQLVIQLINIISRNLENNKIDVRSEENFFETEEVNAKPVFQEPSLNILAPEISVPKDQQQQQVPLEELERVTSTLFDMLVDDLDSIPVDEHEILEGRVLPILTNKLNTFPLPFFNESQKINFIQKLKGDVIFLIQDDTLREELRTCIMQDLKYSL